MNKNRYRIVFNKARNLMMAVAENTTSQGKGQQSGSVGSGSSHPNVAETPLGAKVIELLQLKPIAFAALCMFGLQPALLHAAVTADANADANNRPLIEATANGLPLVQITAPSAAGVSRNQYSQFNVDPGGVILNNSQVNVLTQQGGYVSGNANLANGSARIILNEVTGTGPSSLRGYTEVAGQRAEVIIANPNGIVCDGCGFINTSRGILTTGVPIMSGGSLDSFRVTGGEITIGEGGLNASNTDQLDLITRSLQVNGKIWANNLNAIIGTNQVDYTTLGVQVITGIANQPNVRIDVALLGGMYANKILLVGTEAGVGVNSRGTMAAQAGDFSLNNKGQITLSGRTIATGNVALTTTGDISNSGTLEGNTITTSSNAFNNSSEVLGDVITINAASINNQGTLSRISANTSADLTASGDITNDGTIEAFSVTTHSNNLTNTGTMLGSKLALNAVNLSNTGPSALIAATESIDLIVSNSVSNTAGATIWSLGDLNAGASSTLDADDYLADKMVSFTNSSGTVQADGDLRISADQITNKRTVFEVGQTVVVGDQVNIGDLHYIPTVTTDYVKAFTPAAMLLSGGNMWLKGSISNEYSIVEAVGNIHFDAINFQQISYPPLLSVETQVGSTDNLKWVETGTHTECNWIPVLFGSPWCLSYEVKDYGWVNFPIAYYNTITTVIDSKSGSASFTAGGSLTGIGNTIVNIGVTTADRLGAIQSATPVVGNPNPPALNITLPTKGLFRYNSAPGQNYLIETNPRFANYGNFISSDYMLSRLNLDPALTQKRLGDGFYEQKLVSDQVTGLTGRRFLPGYTSAEAEFKALMEQGLSEAHAQNLVPGVALTTAQVAALTHDIVWMVAQEVHLPNGTTEKLLVPQVFLTRLHEKDLRPNGSLIAAENINLKTSGTLKNSGTILGNKSATLNATDIINQRGSISSNGDTRLSASHDIKNLSGSISGVRVAVLAGHDIVNETETEELQLGNVFTTRIHNTATIAASDSIDLQAGRDISVTGANLVSGGNTTIAAGNNLTINAKAATESASIAASTGASGGISRTTHLTSQIKSGNDLSLKAQNEMKLAAARINAQHKLYVAAKNINVTAVKDVKQSNFNDHRSLSTRNYDEQVIGSTLQAGSDITLVASSKTDNTDDHRGEQHSTDDANVGQSASNGNINLEAATLTSQNGNLSLIADGDVNLSTVDEKHESFSERRTSSSDLFTTTQRTERNESWRTDAIGNDLSGDNVRISSGHDINITGSGINASKGLALAAMNDINITAATQTYGSENYSHEQTNGWQVSSGPLMSDRGTGITHKDRTDGSKQSDRRSTLTSQSGNFDLMAKGNLIASGTDLSANNGDLNLLAGGTVALLAGQDTLSYYSRTQIVTNPNFFTKQQRVNTDTSNSLTYQGSTAQGKKITVRSGDDIVLQAAELKAGEAGLTLDAGHDLKLLAAANSTSSTHTERLDTEGLIFRIDGSIDDLSDSNIDRKVARQTQTQALTRLTSRGDITTRSTRDTLIEASVLEAAGSIDLNAGTEATYNPDGSLKTAGTLGRLIFAAVKDVDYQSEEDKRRSMPWQSQSGNGHFTETLKLANIKAGRGFSTTATGGIVIDIPSVPVPPPVEATEQETTVPAITYDEQGNPQTKPPLTPEQEKAKAVEAAAQAIIAAAQHKRDEEKRYHDHIQNMASQPGQEWIGQLVKQAKTKPDLLKIQQVAAAAKNWDYKAEGLTQEAAVVVVLVVTFFTAGGGSGAAATATGATATGATATGAAAAGTVTVASVTSAAITAGITSLATQAAVSFINNKGDLSRTLNDLSKEERVNAVVTAMITAGVLQGMSEISFLKEIEGYNAKSEYYQQLQKSLINNTASTLVNNAINGGDLEQQLVLSLRSAFFDTTAAQWAKWIGDKKENDKTLNVFTHKLAHAVAGCVIGEARADNCRSGALGAVVGEISAELYAKNNTGAPLTAEQKTDTINFAKMIAGISAAITGNDVNLAAAAGGNAAENNFLGHADAQRRRELRRKFDNGTETPADAMELRLLDERDQVSDRLLAQWKANPESLTNNEKVALNDSVNRYVGDYSGQDRQDKINIMMRLKPEGYGSNGFPYAGGSDAINAYMDEHGYGLTNPRPAPGKYEEMYYKADSLMSNNAYHRGNAELGTPALMFAKGWVGALANFTMMAQGSYQVGQGAGALDNGEYSKAAWDISVGALTMAAGKYGMGLGKGVGANTNVILGSESASPATKGILQQGENSFGGLGDVTTSPWLNDSRAGVRVIIEEFREGGSYLVPKSTYDNWLAGKDVVGRTDGQFMTSKSAMDGLLQEANGNMSIVKQKLGIPAEQWNEPLVRVDVMNPLLHDARLPSGLNSGANSQFKWGGNTSGGMPEIITNPIPKSDISATLVPGAK